MKRVIILLLLLSVKSAGFAQDIYRMDSLYRINEKIWKNKLSQAIQDTSRVLALAKLSEFYKFNKPDTSLYYGYKALELAQSINYPKGEVLALQYIGLSHQILGNLSQTIQESLQGLKIADKNGLTDRKAIISSILGTTFEYLKDYDQAAIFQRQSITLFDSLHITHFSAISRSYLGETYLISGQKDSSLYYNQQAYAIARPLNLDWVSNVVLVNLGNIYKEIGKSDSALFFYYQSLPNATNFNFLFNSVYSIASLFHQLDNPDSSLYYARKSMEIAQIEHSYSDIIEASNLLSEIYEETDFQKSLEYSKMALAYKDSLLFLGNKSSIASYMNFDEIQSQFELNAARKEFQDRLKINALLGSSFTLLVVAFVLFRSRRQKQKSKQQIEEAYDQLKATQSQLIQSEKMASLGELTAGIAHEIQNPLNFVNNFSEVSIDLIEELREERKKKKNNRNTKLEEEILDDLIQNLEKIYHHGGRASSIVKGMLEHSRTGNKEKELTDINILVDEFVRLAYHGLRAKDKSFKADFKLDLDEELPKVKVLSQDIGRVLLNLINNAFYAVSEKSKQSITGYSPQVKISTKRLNSTVVIKVIDNANGISQSTLEKIFQPFFTTKPAGEGTGLGLSISYDIITKGHNGKMQVETKEGEGSEFTIVLPIN